MSFGAELKDFVQGFQQGYDWLDEKDQKKQERADKLDERNYQRSRDAKSDERFERNWNYRAGRDAVDDAFRVAGREHQWEQDERAERRADRQEQRQRDNDDWARYSDGREFGIRREQLEISRRDAERRDERHRLDIAKETGALPNIDRDTLVVPGASPATPRPKTDEAIPSEDAVPGATNFLHKTSWTPGGGSDFQPRSGERTERGTIGMRGQDIAQAMVYDLSRDFGITQEASIGLVGQLAGETGGFTQLQELKPMVPGSRGGGGYAQWTGPRRRQFEKFAAERGLDPRSYEANYGFLRYELSRTGEGRILDKIADARDPIQAGRIFTGSAASRSGFLRPGIVNTAGRDRWTNRVAGLFGGGGRQVRAARGGMIEDVPAPNFEEDDPLGDEYAGVEDQAGETQGSVPVPTPAPREGAIPDPDYDGTEASNDGESEGLARNRRIFEAGEKAVREGLTKIVKDQGYDKDQAIADPELEKLRQNYLKGYGAAPAQMMRQVADMIDPDKKMDVAQRNLAALGNVYNYYMERGEIEKAQAAAASMVQYHQQAFNQFTALAQAAVKEGNMSDATKAALAAYANIPDGRDLKIEETEDGKFVIAFTDAETGETMEQALMDPTQMAEQIMKFNPGTFMDSILQASGRDKTKFETLPPEKRQEYDDATRERVITRAGENTQFGTEQLDIIGDIATNMGSFSENKLVPDQAARLALELAGADAVQDDKDNWVIKEGRKTISSKVPNSDGMYQIKVGGRTIVVDSGTLEDLKNIKGARRKDAEGKVTEGKAGQDRRNEMWTDVGKGFDKITGAVGSAFSTDTSPEGQKRATTRQENLDAAGGAIRDAGAAIGGAVAPVIDAVDPSKGAVDQLLQERQALINNSDPDDYVGQAQMKAKLQRIDAQLRRLGYDPGAERDSAIPE